MYMFHLYEQLYPDLFGHGSYSTRPATNDDYYIPTALAKSCLVVEEMTFDQEGCNSVGCFPFKHLGEPCTANDPVQFTQVGNTFSLSCQPICSSSDTTVDTEWLNDQCVMVNPYKKLVVMFPEKIFQRPTPHQYHSGLSWDHGQIKLNAPYCRAYGLDFNGRECTMTVGQRILEFFYGTTIFRNMRTANLRPIRPTIPPPAPTDMKAIQAAPVSLDNVVDVDSEQLAKDIATEMSADFGLDVGFHVVEKILKKKIPQLISKAAVRASVREAIKHAVIKNAAAITSKTFVTMGRMVSGISAVFSVFSVASLIVDLIDPQMYNYLLTGAMVDKINRKLDLSYFQREDNFNQVVTPEYVWEYVLPQPDQSAQYLYFADKVDEYLSALRPTEKVTTLPKAQFTIDKEILRFNWSLHLMVVGMLLMLTIMWVEWIHIWVCVLFFTIMLVNG
ncbi:hypothetical protein JTE90_022623 [Oedothorax gibbosus]|uniref:Baculoviridae p74 N-terminal domain-containing protein n=1 Tax=Oedothorax gibbosus TaxID=931172 RepID=A0AAV6TT77_9ARAC|nr:hypothetical protein JTE90_022623 [Oedothorax gibbosus]